jgi:hypothetical protein
LLKSGLLNVRSRHKLEAKRITHHHNNEIEPAPSVGEVLGEAKGEELDQHLNEEDDCENSVHVVQDVL